MFVDVEPVFLRIELNHFCITKKNKCITKNQDQKVSLAGSGNLRDNGFSGRFGVFGLRHRAADDQMVGAC